MKYKFDYTNKFKKDYRKLSKSDMADVDAVIKKLLRGEKLAAKHRDHALLGNYQNCRDCHVHPDLVLIYKKENDILLLPALRIGSHSDLF